MNELAKANEELENVATQLYETGQTLDETNVEVGGVHCKGVCYSTRGPLAANKR